MTSPPPCFGKSLGAQQGTLIFWIILTPLKCIVGEAITFTRIAVIFGYCVLLTIIFEAFWGAKAMADFDTCIVLPLRRFWLYTDTTRWEHFSGSGHTEHETTNHSMAKSFLFYNIILSTFTTQRCRNAISEGATKHAWTHADTT